MRPTTRGRVARLDLALIALAMLVAVGCQDPPAPPPAPTPSPPPPPSVTAVPVSQRDSPNGFDIQMGYRTDAPLVLANVKTTWQLEVNGNVTRSAQHNYWEWFTPGTLPATAGTVWDPTDWTAVAPHAGKKFIYPDWIQAANGLVALPPPSGFSVTIKPTHELYTGGSAVGQGAGHPQPVGVFGHLVSQDNGVLPPGPTAPSGPARAPVGAYLRIGGHRLHESPRRPRAGA